MQYRREIDGLRALAVVPVVLFHAGFSSFSGGFVGVDIFFVISGYLITSILIAENEQDRFSIINFYERRARRILPALFFVMACCLPFALMWMLPDGLVEFGRSLIAVTFFVSNFLFWQESGYFAAAAEEKPLLHTWSLAVEEQYYLLFPLLVLMLWPLGRRWFSIVLVVGVLASLGLAEYGWRNKPSANFYLAPFRTWELLIGSLIAVYLSRNSAPAALRDTMSIIGVAMILFSIVWFDAKTPFPSLWALLPVLGTGLLILFTWPETLVGRFFSTPPLVGVGLISYSVYLWHQPLFAFARIHSIDHPSAALFLVLSALSVLLAWLSWRYVEAPFRSKERVSKRAIFTFTGCGMAFFALIGAALVATDGMPARFNAQQQDLLVPLTERTAYVVGRQEQAAELKVFLDDKRPNVLIVGDSFSQDFVNVIAESVDTDEIELAAHFVPNQCQFYIGDEKEDKTAATTSLNCVKLRQVPRTLIESADVLFITAQWQLWALANLESTIKAMNVPSHTKIVVVGRKSFGRVNRSALTQLSAEQRGSFRNTVGSYHLSVVQLGNELNQRYVDLHAALCGSPTATQCPLFNNQGELLSHDGGHLTEAGAKHIASLVGEEVSAAIFGD